MSDSPNACAPGPDHASLETIQVFVKFYYAWFSDGDRFAQKVVDDERKRRGFGWRLPNIRKEGGQPSPPASATANAAVHEYGQMTGSITRRSPKATDTGLRTVTQAAPGLSENVTPANIVRGRALAATTDWHGAHEVSDDDGEDKDDILVFSGSHDVDEYLKAYSDATEDQTLQSSHSASEVCCLMCSLRVTYALPWHTYGCVAGA